MRVTVYGTAGGENSPAAQYYRSGRLAEAHTTYRTLNLQLPVDGVPVDADHNAQRLGEMIYSEIDDAGRLHAVCVLDDEAGDRFAEINQDVYFSPELLMKGGDHGAVYIAREAELRSLSLTFSPATLAAQPVRSMQGDLRRSPDRFQWPTAPPAGTTPATADAAPRNRGLSYSPEPWAASLS